MASCNQLLQQYKSEIISAFTQDADLAQHWERVAPDHDLQALFEQITFQVNNQ